MSKKVLVVGGGWAGTSAAIAAKKAGCEVELCERTDMLLGTGLVGGIMRNNGRFTAAEELIAMGGKEIFNTISENCRHKNIRFPCHEHADLYDIALIEPAIKTLLDSFGIVVHMKTRVKDVLVEEGNVTKVVAEVHGQDELTEFNADVFVDATGTAGPQNNCIKYGNGCAMCIYRCPSFGSRISIVGKAGIEEIIGEKADGTFGAMSGSCKLLKESLSDEIVEKLNRTGVFVISIPDKLQNSMESLAQKACQQYALPEFAQNIILLDTGHAKLMSAYYPLDMLRQIPGFENARYVDPYSGSIGNSMRYFGMSPRDNALKVTGLKNVFCGGEKAGLLVGHTEAIVTGTLAGHNAARFAFGIEPYVIPESIAIGDAIAHVKERMSTKEGLSNKYTFSGSVYFERMKNLNLYTTDINEIEERIEKAGAKGVFDS